VEGPVFGPRQEQAFAHLVEWVALVTRAESTQPPAAMTSEGVAGEIEPASDALPAMEAAGLESRSRTPSGTFAVREGGELSRSLPAEGTYNKLSGPSLTGDTASAESDDVAPRVAAATQPVQFGAQVRTWQPRDPFDPEIFNRRQRARRRPPDLAEPVVEDSVRAGAAP
jgi:hypothetical protein